MIPIKNQAVETNIILRDALAAPQKLTAEAHLESIKVLRTKGYSWREIADFLKERGILADHTTVFRLTTNPKKKRTTKMTTTTLPLAADYKNALQSVPMTVGQLAMLKAHFEAPNRSITYTQLANAAGFDGHVAANSQYGKLARMIGEVVGFDFVDADLRPGEKFYSSAIGFPNPYTEGDFQLVMHHELAKAIGDFEPAWFRNAELDCLGRQFAEENISDDRAQEVLAGLEQLGQPSSEFEVDHDYIAAFVGAVGCEHSDLPRLADEEEVISFTAAVRAQLANRE